MSRITKFIYSPLLFDISFAVAGIFSLLVIAFGSGQGAPAIEPVAAPLQKGLTLVAALGAAVLVAFAVHRADQKYADDYVFAALIRSAAIGLGGVLFFTMSWNFLFVDSYGDIPSLGMAFVAIASWSLGYFAVRLRGTGA